MERVIPRETGYIPRRADGICRSDGRPRPIAHACRHCLVHVDPNTPMRAVSDDRPETIRILEELLLSLEEGALFVFKAERPVSLALAIDFERHSCGGWVSGRRPWTHTRGATG